MAKVFRIKLIETAEIVAIAKDEESALEWAQSHSIQDLDELNCAVEREFGEEVETVTDLDGAYQIKDKEDRYDVVQA